MISLPFLLGSGLFPLLATALPPPQELEAPPTRVAGVALPGGGARIALTLPGADAIALFDGAGNRLQTLSRIPGPLAVEVHGDRVYLGSQAHGAVTSFDFQARPQGQLGAGRGEFGRPSAIAVSPLDGRIHVVDAERREIRIFDPLSLQELGRLGDGFLKRPADLAFAADGSAYVADLLSGTIERFGPSGTPLGSFTRFGSDPGETVRPTGVTLDAAGRVYVVDSFLDHVNVYEANGLHLASLGGFGAGPGRMRNPLDVWVSPADGSVYVTDHGDRALEIFPALP